MPTAFERVATVVATSKMRAGRSTTFPGSAVTGAAEGRVATTVLRCRGVCVGARRSDESDGCRMPGSVAQRRQEPAGLGRVTRREAGVSRQRQFEVASRGDVIPEARCDRARVETQQRVS